MESIAELRRIYHSNRYTKVCRDFYGIMGLDEAVVMSTIIDFYEDRAADIQERIDKKKKLYRIMKMELELGEGWFYCKAESLQRYLKISRSVHDRLINSLIKLQVLKKKLKGMPAIRFLWIDYRNLHDLVNKSFQRRFPVEQHSS